MKKFLIGVVAGLMLAALVGVVLIVGLIRLGSEAQPDVRDGSTLVLNLQGQIPERPPMELPFPGLQAQSPLALKDIWEVLDRAVNDPKIEAAVISPRNVGAGWGKLAEIREGLTRFKESGKPLYAYLRNPGAREYYLATAADRIYVAPEDLLDLKGMRIEAIYLKNTLDKLGINVEIEHAGRYKDAGDMLTRDAMSPETREVLESVLDEMYSHLLSTIGEARGLEPDEVRARLDQGPFLAREAIEQDLLDELAFEDEMYESLRAELAQGETRKVSHRMYRKYMEGSPAAGGRRIALVVGSGSIHGGSGSDGFGDEDAIFSQTFARTIRRVRKDGSVDGVILRIDSPGGDAIASDEILHEIRLLSDEKPMVISMSDVAASGGYYIAMTGDPVVAYPNTITGSIGVIYGKVNLRGFYDKIGVKKEILKRGRYADLDSDYRELTEDGRRKLRAGIDAVYRNFLKIVAEGRGRQLDEIEPLAEGRVWLGAQARRNGLIDELGGLNRAIDLLREEAGIGPDEGIQLVPLPPAAKPLGILAGAGRRFAASRKAA